MVADWLQIRAENNLQSAIDNHDYRADNLIELSVATNLPYTNDWLSWEQVKGTIEVNGYQYQYVERKLEKGKMFYRCLPNHEKQTVVSARDQFEQLVNNYNQQTDHKSPSKSIVISNFIGDYDDAFVEYKTHKPSFEYLKAYTSSPESSLQTRQILKPYQPPEC